MECICTCIEGGERGHDDDEASKQDGREHYRNEEHNWERGREREPQRGRKGEEEEDLLKASKAAVVTTGEGGGAAVGTEDLHTHRAGGDFIVQGLRRRALIRQQHVGGDAKVRGGGHAAARTEGGANRRPSREDYQEEAGGDSDTTGGIAGNKQESEAGERPPRKRKMREPGEAIEGGRWKTNERYGPRDAPALRALQSKLRPSLPKPDALRPPSPLPASPVLTARSPGIIAPARLPGIPRSPADGALAVFPFTCRALFFLVALALAFYRETELASGRAP